MSDRWTEEELEASVRAYIDMRERQSAGERISKVEYYRNLSEQYGRTNKAYEYRMQNISYVYSAMGRDWVKGLVPAKNVGVGVAEQLETIIAKLENQSFIKQAAFMARVSTSRKGYEGKSLPPPIGQEQPTRSTSEVTQFNRDSRVVAWVLVEANGICECCGDPAPFTKDDGTSYLEVHHLRRLADGGTDRTTNAVALCPNCHRELHYGVDRDARLVDIYSRVERLIPE